MSEKAAENQNTDENESHKNEDVNQPDQISGALDPIISTTETRPSIFKLVNDCWQEIFDYLSIRELHTFGQTCKHLQRITGEYFKWMYSCLKMDPGWMDQLEGFIPFAQHCDIHTDFADFANIMFEKNIKPKGLRISDVNNQPINFNLLIESLKGVELVEFRYTQYDATFFEKFLKVCVNLKHLLIYTNAENIWIRHKFPTLQHLSLTNCDSLTNDELTLFFKQNPNVRSFGTSAKILLKHRHLFIANNIEFDDLAIWDIGGIEELCEVVNDLYERGIYKKLHLTTTSVDNLEKYPGLDTLRVRAFDGMMIPKLNSVTKLYFKVWGNLLHLNIEKTSMNLKNIERIFNRSENISMMPFIRNSKKLKEITMGFPHNDLDVVAMNKERSKLKCATKVTIYLEEKDYLAMKWKHNDTNFEWIEVRRKFSYQGVIWDRITGHDAFIMDAI